MLLMPGGYAFPGKNKNSTDDNDFWAKQKRHKNACWCTELVYNIT
jgi:hypothetical protein